MRRDGKDDSAVAGVIGAEFERAVESMEHAHFIRSVPGEGLPLTDSPPVTSRARIPMYVT